MKTYIQTSLKHNSRFTGSWEPRYDLFPHWLSPLFIRCIDS